jgi:hypothetical protein
MSNVELFELRFLVLLKQPLCHFPLSYGIRWCLVGAWDSFVGALHATEDYGFRLHNSAH